MASSPAVLLDIGGRHLALGQSLSSNSTVCLLFENIPAARTQNKSLGTFPDKRKRKKFNIAIFYGNVYKTLFKSELLWDILCIVAIFIPNSKSLSRYCSLPLCAILFYCCNYTIWTYCRLQFWCIFFAKWLIYFAVIILYYCTVEIKKTRGGHVLLFLIRFLLRLSSSMLRRFCSPVIFLYKGGIPHLIYKLWWRICQSSLFEAHKINATIWAEKK